MSTFHPVLSLASVHRAYELLDQSSGEHANLPHALAEDDDRWCTVGVNLREQGPKLFETRVYRLAEHTSVGIKLVADTCVGEKLLARFCER